MENEKRERTSLWPLAAAKWRGELRPPKVEYLARHGLQSNSILASIKSPSRAADTSLSPDAEHPNELPILSPSLFLSLVRACWWRVSVCLNEFRMATNLSVLGQPSYTKFKEKKDKKEIQDVFWNWVRSCR
jgi:hypothetical protein